jgi:hypothetical protein|tara:strand:- start:14 stop:139 length:126 start_codon:yes stop_codon:yes gene_type:complete
MKISFYPLTIAHAVQENDHAGGVNQLPSEEMVVEEAALELS